MNKVPEYKEEWLLKISIAIFFSVSSFFAAKYFNRNEIEDNKHDKQLKENHDDILETKERTSKNAVVGTSNSNEIKRQAIINMRQ